METEILAILEIEILILIAVIMAAIAGFAWLHHWIRN